MSEPPPNRLQISEASRLVTLRTTALANAVNTGHLRTKILTASLRMRKTARLFRQFNSTASRCVTIRPFCSGCSTVARIGCRFFHRRSHPRFYVRSFRKPDAHSHESSLRLRVCPMRSPLMRSPLLSVAPATNLVRDCPIGTARICRIANEEWGSGTPSRTCPRTQLSGRDHRRASSTQSMIS